MKPILQALLVADRVYTDAVTQKKIVVGIFSQINFIRTESFQAAVEQNTGQLPTMPGGYNAGSPFAYANLTSVHGEQRFVLRYVDLSDDSVVFQGEIKVECKDPLSPVEIVIPLPALPATKSGVFALELLWNENDPMGSFRITVKEQQIGEHHDG
ncbi:MAG: hypothetical protein EXS05_06370 [Planctomycetaceae bacterium]|nr:hypothetical protein [Planctomycetaceae bacterium]